MSPNYVVNSIKAIEKNGMFYSSSTWPHIPEKMKEEYVTQSMFTFKKLALVARDLS